MVDLDQQKKKIQVLNRLVGRYGFQEWWESDNKLADCLSMILIQQTTEKNAKQALNHLTPYLKVELLAEMSLEKLQTLIYPAGFYKQKSQYIKEFIHWFQKNGENFDSFEHYSTEQLRKELLSIKGIGEETADVLLLYIFERNVFIADRYAWRLFTRLGFGNYQQYEEMRQEFLPLAEKIPYLLCKEWHAAIDTHGKIYRKTKNMAEHWLINHKKLDTD